MSKSKNEKMTELYNQSGLPFQDWCFMTVRKHGNYRAVTEFPFTNPPSAGAQIGKQGSIDIVAVSPQNARWNYLVIECKKANPEIKNWIFYSREPNTPNGEYISRPTFLMRRTVEGEVEKISKISFPQLGYDHYENFDYCVSGLEFNEKITSGNRNEIDKIYNHIFQVTRGLNAFAKLDPKQIDEVEADGVALPDAVPVVYIPVIVTTADLYLAKYDWRNVEGGEVPESSIEYEPKNWLTYEFGLPDFLKLDKGAVEKQTIFIVNEKSWVDFLGKVKDIKGNSETQTWQ